MDTPTQTFPPVTWDEVVDHFVKELRTDTEWMDLSPEAKVLSWWPGFLRQEIRVGAEGNYSPDSTENWIRVTVSTKIAKTDPDTATRLVKEFADSYFLGGFFHFDGVIQMSRSLVLNPLCRELLHWLHNAALIQASVAHEMAAEWLDTPGLEMLVSEHPVNGTRWKLDELLEFFMGSEFSASLGSLDDVLLEGVRLLYKDTLLKNYREGFTNSDVDFFNLPTFDIGIGRKPLDNPWGKKFGDGLHVVVSLTGTVLPDEYINLINAAIAASFTSQMGNVVGAEWTGKRPEYERLFPTSS